MKIIRWIVLGAVGAALSPVFSLAQDAGEGQRLYERHCASCHGLEATGHGPMRPVLIVQPKDLTVLSRENGGEFPLERVVKRIDGRDPLVSHGSPMPVYGDFFQEFGDVSIKTPAGQPVMTSRPVADLVAYLEALQAE